MAHVVIGACDGCKYTDCVEVCPVDCFHEDENMLLIDPYECIDCEACVPVCPVEAIYLEDNLPEGERHWIEINARKAPDLPVIIDKKPGLKPYP